MLNWSVRESHEPKPNINILKEKLNSMNGFKCSVNKVSYLAITVKSLRCLRALRAGLVGWTPFCQKGKDMIAQDVFRWHITVT